MEKPVKILVCGGGNGAHTLAATASTYKNITVNVMTLFADEAQRWSDKLGSGSIEVDLVNGDESHTRLDGKPACITKDPAKAMDGVDAVFFVVPAFAHQQYFEAIAPFIKPNTTIVGMPGQAGFEIQAQAVLKDKAETCAILSFESLPWACRILDFGVKVQILGKKDVLGSSLIQGKKGKFSIEPLVIAQGVLGDKPVLSKTQNYIAVNLMAKSIIHPPLMYGQWKDWDGKPLAEAPLFYQGVDDLQASLLSSISDELIATGNAIHAKRNDLEFGEVIHIFDWFKTYYKDQVANPENLKTCLQSNAAYNGLLHPVKKVDGGVVPDFTYRYTTEDIPFGLVILKGIAECAGVQTPTMDKMIEWGQSKMGKEYIVDGKLKGKDVTQTRAPQAYGFTTLEDLCKML